MNIKDLYKYIPIKKLREYAILKQKKHSLFNTGHSRPSYSEFVTTFSDEVIDEKHLAIVMQGPIAKDDDFTLETVKIYKKLFSNSKIIISTWENEDKDYLKLIEAEDVEIVLSKLPEYNGICNVNFQIESSKNGIKRAKEMGFEYAIKTRTDQRMYAPNIKEFLFNTLKTFPLKTGLKNQKKRLVGCSFNTFKYRLYGVSDMFLFGQIDDMILYWSPDYDLRKLEDLKENPTDNIKIYCENRLCEVYFCTEFLKKIGKDINFTLKNSWQIYAEHFCIIDKESLDLYWPKYTNREYRWLEYKPSHLEELNFREWLILYSNLDNKKHIPEEFLINGVK